MAVTVVVGGPLGSDPFSAKILSSFKLLAPRTSVRSVYVILP